jgi:hypothetical protein
MLYNKERLSRRLKGRKPEDNNNNKVIKSLVNLVFTVINEILLIILIGINYL